MKFWTWVLAPAVVIGMAVSAGFDTSDQPWTERRINTT
jgi:hypothetical protein